MFHHFPRFPSIFPINRPKIAGCWVAGFPLPQENSTCQGDPRGMICICPSEGQTHGPELGRTPGRLGEFLPANSTSVENSDCQCSAKFMLFHVIWSMLMICWWYLILFWYYFDGIWCYVDGIWCYFDGIWCYFDGMFLFWWSFLILMLYLLQSQAVKYADPNNLNDLHDSISNFCRILHMHKMCAGLQPKRRRGSHPRSRTNGMSWPSCFELPPATEDSLVINKTNGRSCLKPRANLAGWKLPMKIFRMINWPPVAAHSYRML